MDEQVGYVGRTAKLKHLPSEHFAAGRVFCNIEAHEHEPMFNMVTGALGDGVLMFGSDYPHYESWFPESVDKILDWSRSEEHTSELQSHLNLVCRLLLEKKKKTTNSTPRNPHKL